MKTEHTPLPWSWREFFGTDAHNEEMRKHGIAPVQALTNDGARAIFSDDRRVAEVDCQAKYKRGKGSETHCAERDANAALIVRAVNSHDELVAALDNLLSAVERKCVTVGDWNQSRAALAKARS